ncbi:histone acetyltransferase GCN5 [Coemansia reversa NRRL 1564]|uniref:histone acetyltransferase n=1 Tax=Coemansia reversa (strain ATCC 12441 / NRRL 1564) TaxID=763665 RepID=A0A2G5B822_COERN|nr:histone acetyltransferase GCN5 [Coemansia reversa NRRL 1564]|eukprot:PIA15144.1 histone acetyltransferase GCN5 [Coemansia reversa NRRL 1564]
MTMSTYGEKYESRQNATRANDTHGSTGSTRKRPRSESESAKRDEAVVPGEEKTALAEQENGMVRFEVVYNDTEDESMQRLTELKNIFQKQLPKMPKEYIARLVYDRNHSSLAIIKANGHVVGGITFRLFEQRQFAEIVFCAVSSTEQVKGYGSFLMNNLKDYISANTQARHFLTYADNYAIGYFQKQGFTKDITLDKRLWMGYIKDYEGGTLMQCSMVPKVEYLRVKDILAKQREAVLEKIQAKTRSQIVYPGMKNFKENPELTEIDPFSIPGIVESGWTPEMDEISRRHARSKLNTWQITVVGEMLVHPSAWPFQKPVDSQEVPDYYNVVKEPMDLMTLESNVDENKYPTLDAFVRDARKIFDNCRNYNGEGTRYWRCATSLEKFFDDKVKEWKSRTEK